jgi:hypothetical protein
LIQLKSDARRVINKVRAEPFSVPRHARRPLAINDCPAGTPL